MPTKQLSVEQRYVLQRIPGKYQIDKKLKSEEPATVKKARAIVDRYDADQSKRQKAHEDKIDKMIEDAREAVYFKPLDKALELVKKLEAFGR